MGVKSLPTIRQPAVASGIKLLTMHGQGALAAFGIAGGAAVPAKEDDAVAEVGAFLRGEDLAQLLFHLFGLLALAQAQTAADSDAVGIADDTAGNTVEITQQKIRCFSTNTG